MPEVARCVIVNTTPLIALAKIGQLELLHHLYGEVLIPPAVREEVLHGGADRAGTVELDRASWIREVALQRPVNVALLVDLDRGEAEVLILAQSKMLTW